MQIVQTRDGDKLILGLIGRLDSNTSSVAETEILAVIPGIPALELDLTEVKYISSAGLRMLLTIQKQMNHQGTMIVSHVNENIMEILNISGFTEILKIV